MSLSTRLALESDLVTTDVVSVALFPYLAVRYQADDVPTTVVNGRKAAVGAAADEEYVRKVVAAAS